MLNRVARIGALVVAILVVSGSVLGLRWWIGQKSPVHLASFGPVGNGISDDTISIQRALDASAGRTLIIDKPKVVYRITSTLAVRDKTRMIGDGVVTIEIAVANIACFVTGNDNEFANLRFRGTGNYAVGGRGCIECDPNNTGKTGHRIYVHGCEIMPSISTSGISGNNVVDSIIEDNVITLGKQGEHGIYLSTGSARTIVRRNTIRKMNKGPMIGCCGINLKGTKDLIIEDNSICGSGFDGYAIVSSTADSNRLTIRRNRIGPTGLGSSSIRVGSACKDSYIMVERNNIDGGDATWFGVYSQANHCCIRNNHFARTVFRAVEIVGDGAARTDHTTVQKNVAVDCGGGYRFAPADNHTVCVANTYHSRVGVGVEWSGAENGVIARNRIVTNSVAFRFPKGVQNWDNSPPP